MPGLYAQDPQWQALREEAAEATREVHSLPPIARDLCYRLMGAAGGNAAALHNELAQYPQKVLRLTTVKAGPQAVEQWITDKQGQGQTPMRIRWDILWSALGREPLGYSGGLTDEHIDTALRRIMREMGLPELAG